MLKKPSSKKRDIRVMSFEASPDLWKRITAAAAKDGISKSDVIRAAIHNGLSLPPKQKQIPAEI
jgi:Ribbon-helix-helix protein, copG family